MEVWRARRGWGWGWGKRNTAQAPPPGLREGPLGHAMPWSPRDAAGDRAVFPAQPDAAHSTHRRRHLLLTQQRAAVLAPLLTGTKPQAPWFPSGCIYTPTCQRYRPRALPGTLRPGLGGCYSKEGSGIPPWTLRGLDKLVGPTTLASCPYSIPAPEVTDIELEPQFPHLSKGDNKSSCPTEL